MWRQGASGTGSVTVTSSTPGWLICRTKVGKLKFFFEDLVKEGSEHFGVYGTFVEATKLGCIN